MLLQNQKTNFSALLIDIVFLAAPECTTVRIEERWVRVDQGQESDQLINGARGDHMKKKPFWGVDSSDGGRPKTYLEISFCCQEDKHWIQVKIWNWQCVEFEMYLWWNDAAPAHLFKLASNLFNLSKFVLKCNKALNGCVLSSGTVWARQTKSGVQIKPGVQI